MVLGNLPAPGRPCSRCAWGLFGHIYSRLSLLSSFSGWGGVGWSGGAMVLGKLPVPGRPTIWIRVGQGVGAGGVCVDIFTLIYPFSPLSPSLWETARYRLKYCLKGPLNPKQPTLRGWSGGAKVLCKLPVPGRPTSLDKSRARAYCACSWCGWGLFGHFFSRLLFLFIRHLSGKRPDID